MLKGPRTLVLAAAGLGLSLVVTACGDDGDDTAAEEQPADAATGEADGEDEADEQGEEQAEERGELTVGGATFTEMTVMQEMYRALLEDAGYTVDISSAENREIYAQALEAGEIDVVPEYAATMAEYLNAQINGPDAPSESPVATNDAAETVEAMRPLAEERGLQVLEPAEAADQNGFAVTQEFADENGVSTLSDLAALGEPIVLAATEECPDRPFCEPGLEETYGLEITEILPLGFSSPQTKEAVTSGEADLGLVATTDGTLADLGLALLEDDENLQLADNLVPVVNAETAGDQAIADALNQLADVLTTEDLATLNARVDAERELPEDVARSYLEEEGLL
ncbi:MAG: ABC transporter substrate-binding protein [Actinomycetota bacterium]